MALRHLDATKIPLSLLENAWRPDSVIRAEKDAIKAALKGVH